MSCIAILPARGGSKRLRRKNLYPVFGKPMLSWVVEACRAVPEISTVCVTSEDNEILSLADSLGCLLVRRPDDLAEDNVPKMEAVRHCWQVLSEADRQGVDRIVSVQSNSPELRSSDLRKGLQLMEKNRLWEVVSVGRDMVQNGAFRIIHLDALFNTFLSAHLGVVLTDYIDIHTQEDVDLLNEKYKSTAEFLEFKGA